MPHAECSMHLGESMTNNLLTSIMVILADFPLLNDHPFEGSYCHRITQAIIHAPNSLRLRFFSNSPTAKHFLESRDMVWRNQVLSTCIKIGFSKVCGISQYNRFASTISRSKHLSCILLRISSASCLTCRFGTLYIQFLVGQDPAEPFPMFSLMLENISHASVYVCTILQCTYIYT